MFSQNPKLLQKITLDVWEKSDRTTSINFLKTAISNNGCTYNSTRHRLTICPFGIDTLSQKPEILSIDPLFVAQCVVAHELGHSIMENFDYRELFFWVHEHRKTETQENFTAYFSVYKKKVLKNELQAWKNARFFLESNYSKSDFYRIVRRSLSDCNKALTTNYDYFVDDFDKLTII